MTVGTATYGDINQRTAVYAVKEMLAHAEPILVLSKFGLPKPMPKNAAQSAKFRRPIPFTVSTAPLVEGVTPTSKKIQYEDVLVKLEQYGDVSELTDVVEDLAEDPVLKDMSKLAGEQAAETIEMVTYGAIKAGTNVFYDTAAHTTRATVDSKLTKNRLRAVVRSLRANRGKEITSMMSSSVKYGSEAVEGGFVAFCHSDLDADIRDIAGFVSVADYGSMQTLCPEELGTVEKIRFITSPLLVPFQAAGAAVGATGMVADDATNIDVYPILIVAKDAYGLIPLKGFNAITPSVINPNQPTKDDPLGQRGYVGWKSYFAAKILNEAWIARLEVAATAI